jgi:MFS family permease
VVRERPQLFPLAASLFLFSLAYSQVLFSLPLHAVHLLQDDGPRAFGLAMSTNGLAIVIITPLLARLSSRASSLVWVALGGLLYALGFGSVALIAGLPGLVGTTVIWSVGEVLVATNWRIYVADHSPSSHRARLSGLMQNFFGGGFVIGPLLGARVIGRLGTTAVWPACLVVAALGTAIIVGWLGWERRSAASVGVGS